jgi:hypothetical protein
MARRVAAIILFVVGAYLAAVGITVGATILRPLLEGPWLGLEPEILIPTGICLVAVVFIWMAMKLWRQQEHG